MPYGVSIIQIIPKLFSMICVGIDVAKHKHDCFILSSKSEVLTDAFTIPIKNAPPLRCPLLPPVLA